MLDADDVQRVLAASPEPFATATREKRAALGRFQPHGVLISDAADRPDRRRWNEAVLDTARPVHHLAGPLTDVVREEARGLRRRRRHPRRHTLLEAVRLWPTTPAILRETTAPAELGGTTLPAHTLVLICSTFFHRDDERRDWADRFTPELWRAGTPDAALVPFSAGPAVCAGQNLVLFLTSTFLTALLDGHDLAPARVPISPGRPLPGTLDPFRLRVTLVPHS